MVLFLLSLDEVYIREDLHGEIIWSNVSGKTISAILRTSKATEFHIRYLQRKLPYDGGYLWFDRIKVCIIWYFLAVNKAT